MTKKQYRLNKWGTRLLKNNRPLFDWANEADDIVDLLNELHEEKDYSEKKKCEYWNKFNLTHLDNINLRKENKQLKKEYLKLKHRHSLIHDVCLDAECERDSLKKDVESLEKENEQLKQQNKMLRTNVGKLTDDVKYLRNLPSTHQKENEQLKSEIQQYKALLQDMGLLMSDNEVNDIRNDIADKFLKPLFKMNGFDVDINTDDGFTIIPKGDDGVWVKNK